MFLFAEEDNGSLVVIVTLDLFFCLDEPNIINPDSCFEDEHYSRPKHMQ